ncbi:MAG TPA: hypothetical protein VLF39_00495 [Candidatus Saccharimonadales bacterium]|nr:hypothetical protein [Candidatus Saccharimonadales bacterium]
MNLVGETEFALVDPEQDASVDWSALNLVIADMKNHGYPSPVELEDSYGQIKSPVGPDELTNLAGFLITHSEVIAYESELKERQESKHDHTFTGARNTITFLRSAIGVFRESVRNRRELKVEERLVNDIKIRPETTDIFD